MNSPAITITLPDPIYHQIKQQSQLMQRSVAEQLVAVVIDYSQTERLDNDIELELAQLEFMTVQEIRQAAQLTVSPKQSQFMQELVEKQQREGLSVSESQQAQQLSHFFNRVMLIRAKAAFLLKQRGYYIT